MLKNEDVKKDDAQLVSAGIQSTKKDPNITNEPQHEEHLHMALLGESLPLREVYLKVSDDQGQFFNNMPLEKIMIDFLGQSKTVTRTSSAEAIRQLMAQLIDVSKSYQKQINLATSVSSGILVKHQIRLGNMFMYQKKLLKKINPEKNWTEWFSETYGSGNLRSAQDYMRMAGTPNIIRYAVFGKERLIEILRATPAFASSDDPIGAFLSKHNFTFNPEAETSMEDWRSSIDAAIAMEKIKLIERKEGIELGLSFEQVKRLIDGNVPVDSKVISNMVIVKDSGGNLEEYINSSILAKGGQNVQIERSEKLESVQRISKKLKEIVEYYTKDVDALSEISSNAVNDLKASIDALISLINK